MPLNRPLADWSGQRVWLIGASSGIGAALADALHARGATVVLSARNGAALAARVSRLGGERALALPLDVTDSGAVRDAERAIVARLGGYDRVILLAGDYRPQTAATFELASARALLDVNLGGTLNVLAAVLPHLLAAGSGGIAFVASVAGYRGLPRSLVYGPTKAALIHLAEALHLELPAHGIDVHLVNPGFVATPLTAGNTFPMPFLMGAEDAALRIVAGYARGDFEIAFPRRLALPLRLLRCLPFAWYRTLVKWRTGL